MELCVLAAEEGRIIKYRDLVKGGKVTGERREEKQSNVRAIFSSLMLRCALDLSFCLQTLTIVIT